eukprot:7604012-Pyramimonas_sp.AAC.1
MPDTLSSQIRFGGCPRRGRWVQHPQGRPPGVFARAHSRPRCAGVSRGLRVSTPDISRQGVRISQAGRWFQHP